VRGPETCRSLDLTGFSAVACQEFGLAFGDVRDRPALTSLFNQLGGFSEPFEPFFRLPCLPVKLGESNKVKRRSQVGPSANNLPIIFLTAHANVSSSVRALKSGAVDFLEKPVGRDTLLEAVGRALARDLERRTERDRSHQLRARFALLTRREREIFDRVVVGKANKIIAEELGIAERTVKVHRAQLMAKLGVASSAEFGGLAEQLHRLPD
jgi:FixJ family two-component response regulator